MNQSVSSLHIVSVLHIFILHMKSVNNLDLDYYTLYYQGIFTFWPTIQTDFH